ncbi:MAG: hypothetical protein KDA42_17025 [Planctomycetales bacterium]|nr:hypothetical protein [Planctomycetales bacterium]
MSSLSSAPAAGVSSTTSPASSAATTGGAASSAGASSALVASLSSAGGASSSAAASAGCSAGSSELVASSASPVADSADAASSSLAAAVSLDSGVWLCAWCAKVKHIARKRHKQRGVANRNRSSEERVNRIENGPFESCGMNDERRISVASRCAEEGERLGSQSCAAEEEVPQKLDVAVFQPWQIPFQTRRCRRDVIAEAYACNGIVPKRHKLRIIQQLRKSCDFRSGCPGCQP